MKPYHKLSIAILILSMLPTVYQIDKFRLWQDEAETALVASSLSTSPIPLGNDGVNSFSQQFDKEMGASNEWKLHPWLQFYWAYGITSLFGTSDVALRLGFAFFSLLTLALTLCIPLIYKDHKLQKAALLGAVFLGFNIGFVLLTRQVRYYAPNMFFITASLVFGYRFVRATHGNFIWLIASVLSTILLFHTSYLSAIAMVAASGAFLLVNRGKRTWTLLFGMGLAILIHIPYLLWMLDSPYFNERLASNGDATPLTNFFLYLKTVGKHYFQWPFLIALLLLLRSARNTKKQEVATKMQVLALVVFPLTYLTVVSVASEAYFARYLCGLLPLLAFIKGYSFDALLAQLQKPKYWHPITVAIVLLMAEPYGKYWQSLSEEKQGPISAKVAFFDEKLPLTPEMSVFTSYGDLCLKWYLKQQVWGASEPYNELMSRADIMIYRRFAMGLEQAKQIERIKKEQKQKEYMVTGLTNSIDRPYEVRETPDEYFELFEKASYPEVQVMAKRSSFQTQD